MNPADSTLPTDSIVPQPIATNELRINQEQPTGTSVVSVSTGTPVSTTSITSPPSSPVG